MKDNQTVLATPDGHAGKGAKDTGGKTFAFDRSYWSFDKDDSNYAGQSHLFDDLGAPLLDNAFQGYNNCIFAYGQTGSGKSYSMMGYGKEVGIIPNICQEMFKRIDAIQEDKTTKCTVEVSYLEIYNERVRDLLNPATKGNLKVREHPSTGPYVEDLAKLVVGSFQEIENLMDEGNKARTVAATNMNETSSRSHAVFTLMLTQKKYDVETKMEMEKVAKISLVDLAGSERATSTGATGARLKEGAEINRSLSTLGRVIAALADLSTGKKKKGATQVPYRDSVLTWLLKDSLGGNSMTAMIAAISPADINYDETLSTLRYADSAKRIKNHAVINEDANARMIRELKEELALLRSKLGGGVVAPGGSPIPAEEVYAEGTPLEKQIVTITTADGTVKKVSKADIAEQLTQSEKLLSDLNQTWEQKLQKTEEIHKEREVALEELGISIEKGFIGLSTPKKMPHLVNLSDDPLLAECLVYNLKPGTTTVGNVETNADNQVGIRLNGTRILHDHCRFENNADGTVVLAPSDGASVMVNGKRITEPKQLHSGYRVILGDFHIFRFNHPLEAKAERAEVGSSLLRQSITASQLQALDQSPSPRLGHQRSMSRFSDFGDPRPDSPATFLRNGRDSDWSLARREAAGAILGSDQNLTSLSDDELNALFEDVQRARAERVIPREDGEDTESNVSYQLREKYMSAGTIDNFSLDTALTMPSTPKQGEHEAWLREAKEELQSQLEKQKEEFQEQLKSAEIANVEVEEIKKEKAKMEAALMLLKEDMQKQLNLQRKQYEEKIDRMDPLKRRKANPKLSDAEIQQAKKVMKIWRGRRFVKMAETVLQNAAVLKEAQIASNELQEHVVFQFAVVDVGHALCSSYDMVLNGLTGEGEDLALEEVQKPCIGVRVIDFNHSVVRLWSLDKLHDRVRQMRQMRQYLDQPEYAQHLSLDNPFVEPCMPSYTLVGEVDVPLRAVFESRVQDFSVDVVSPYTSHAIGMIKLSLEPSHARAPTNTLKFNVVMHELVGFAEREGTEVHAQLFVPGVSEEDGVTTTQMISDFDEGPIRFESVHNMSVSVFAPPDVMLRAAIFAKVSTMHLDKLLSWDDLRDAVPKREDTVKGSRINESQFYTQEKHDLLSRIQIMELDENGEYHPVEVSQTSELDIGTFQLHQGLQRRIGINISHSSGHALPWGDVTAVRVGKVRLLDSAGKTPDMCPGEPNVCLKLASNPIFRENPNGTHSITVYAQWDSSLHNSLLLDRVTADKYRVQMTVHWEISSEKLAEPMKFSQKVCVQILSRTFVRQTSVFSSLWQNVRFVRSSTGIFTLTMRPAPVKRAGDLWRMSSQHDYVKGEENLTSWAPRGVSLVSDFILARRKRKRMAEIGSVQTTLHRLGVDIGSVRAVETDPDSDLVHDNQIIVPDDDDDVLNDTPETSPAPSVDGRVDGEEEETIKLEDVPTSMQASTAENHQVQSEYSERDTELLERCLSLWLRYPDPLRTILSPANTTPPADGVATDPSIPPSLITTIIRVPKNPKVLKGGYLLVPNNDSTRWVKRFVELRRPYLHIHSATDGDEVALVSLRNSRIDSQPGVLGLLHGPDGDDGPTDNTPGSDLTPGHRRTASGRVISTIWTGSGGGSPKGSGPGLHRLSERMQAAVFAVYGADNTWLFAARSEKDKMDWIFRIDQTYMSGSGSTPNSGTASPLN